MYVFHLGCYTTGFTKRKLQAEGKDLPSSIPLAYPDDCLYDPENFLIVTSQNQSTGPAKLVLASEAIQLLTDSIGERPVAVVSICGPYRSGKSYFISRLLDQREAFKLGHTAEACTRGIWLSTYVLECDGFTVLFLDTEGADAVGKGHTCEQFSTSLFTMTTLLSSLLIYNTHYGVPTQNDVIKLK